MKVSGPHIPRKLKTNQKNYLKGLRSPLLPAEYFSATSLSTSPKESTVKGIFNVFAGYRSPQSSSFHRDSITQKKECCLPCHRLQELNHFLSCFCARIRSMESFCLRTHARPINSDMMLTRLKPYEDCRAQPPLAEPALQFSLKPLNPTSLTVLLLNLVAHQPYFHVG